MTFELRRYRRATGGEPFTEWLTVLRDRQARARILARLERLEAGNFGDVKFLRDGVCGGDKRKQDADIKRAVELWQEYVDRKKAALPPKS
jgi:putative component of toxin-antitoxin plasmid stabilization module